MKKTFLLGLLTCVLGLFTACSSDKNDDNNGGTIPPPEQCVTL